MQNEPSPDDTPQDAAFRYGIGTLLLLTLMVGMILAYSRQYGEFALRMASISSVAAVIIGTVAGLCFGGRVARVFWALVASAMIQIVTTNVLLVDRSGYLAWPMIAALTAAIAVPRRSADPAFSESNDGPAGKRTNSSPGMIVARMTVAAGIALVAHTAYTTYAVVSLGVPLTLMQSESACALLGGALLVVMMEACAYVQGRLHISQMVLAVVLVALSIAVALAGKQFVPGW